MSITRTTASRVPDRAAVGVSRPIDLDLTDPVRDFLARAGLTQVQLAEADGVVQSAIAGAVKRGGGIGLDVFVRLVRAGGWRLVLRIERGRRGVPAVTDSADLDPTAPVRSFRTAAGLTQEQLAEADGVHQHTISGAEKRGGGLGLDVLVRLVKAGGWRLVLRIERDP